MKYSLHYILLFVFVLTACNSKISPKATSTSQPTATVEPTKTLTPIPQPTSTLTKAPTATSELGDIESLVVADGFTISIPFPLLYQKDKNVVLVGTDDKIFTASFTSETYDGIQPLTDVIDTYLASLEKRGWQFSKGKSINIEVDGSPGMVVDLTGTAGDLKFEGQSIAVSPRSDQVLFGLGISLTNTDEDTWTSSGKTSFAALLDGIKFSNDDAMCPVSTDQTYGFIESNPIQLGGDSFGGPSRERAYLDNLRGPNGEMLSYERVGSIATDTTILDGYLIPGPVINVTLYLDVYTYESPQAPMGFTCQGAFPFSSP